MASINVITKQRRKKGFYSRTCYVLILALKEYLLFIMPGTTLSALCGLFHLILQITPWGGSITMSI